MRSVAGGLDVALHPTDRVDILDVNTKQWVMPPAKLSQPRFLLYGATVGDFTFFSPGIYEFLLVRDPCAGLTHNILDVFNAATKQWTFHNFSVRGVLLERPVMFPLQESAASQAVATTKSKFLLARSGTVV